MAGWENSDRRSRLPKDWHRRRARAKRTATQSSPLGIAQCQHITDGMRCTEVGTDCDHIVNNDNDDASNLQWLCHPHHLTKTAAESATARAAIRNLKHRPQPRHPGLR